MDINNILRVSLCISTVFTLAGCTVFNTDSQRAHDQTLNFSTATTFTTADARIITQRDQPVVHNTIVCTEPAPDVAKALSTALQGTAQGGNGAVTAALGFSGGSAETAAELAGRSTALLGLRDGLYRACEAYANGVIGGDAYAQVLSRYGQLMSTLFLGQDITGSAGTTASVLATSAAISLAAQQAASGADPKTPATTTGKIAALAPSTMPAVGSDTVPAAHVLLAAAGAGALAAPGAAANQSAGDAANKGATDTTTTGGTNIPASTGTNPTQTAATAAAGVNATAALALTRMNEDYIGLDLNFAGTLLVACINEYDPTRMHQEVVVGDGKGGLVTDALGHPVMTASYNTWLVKLCGQLDTISKFETALQSAAKAAVLSSASIVHPDTVAVPEKASAAPKAAAAVGDPTLKLVQEALQKGGFYNGKIDGLTGPETTAAIRAFQIQNHLPLTGAIDPATLGALFGNTPA